LLDRAYQAFLKTTDRPTLILVHSHIGYGAPHLQDSPKAHGEPLGEDELKLTKRILRLSAGPEFVVPDAVPKHFAAGMGARGAAAHAAWDKLLAGYRAPIPSSPFRSTPSRPARCRKAGIPPCRASRPMRRAWRRAMPRARC
jgi:transketolase